MYLNIKKKYIFYLILILIFSTSSEISNFLKNKKIVRYDIIYNTRSLLNHVEYVEVNFLGILKSIIPIQSEILNFSNEEYYKSNVNYKNIDFDKNMVFLVIPADYNEKNIISIIRKEFKKNFHKDFKEYINEKKLDLKIKNSLIEDVNKNLNIGLLIDTNMGETINQITFKTFYPEHINDFLNMFAIKIKQSIIFDWNKSLKNQILARFRINFYNRIRDKISLLESKNIFIPFKIIKDNSFMLENFNYYDPNEIIEICKFLDLKSEKNDRSFLETYKLIENINNEKYEFSNTKEFFKIEKVSEKKFLDIYKIWSSIIFWIFLILIIEIIYSKIKK